MKAFTKATIGLLGVTIFGLSGCNNTCQEPSKTIENNQVGNWIESGQRAKEDGSTELIEFNLASTTPHQENNQLKNVVMKQTWSNKQKGGKQTNLWLVTVDCVNQKGYAIASVEDVEGQALFSYENLELQPDVYRKGITSTCNTQKSTP